MPSSWPPNEPTRWSITLPREPAAARTARSAVEGWLARAPADVRDAARSLVTELVSNAIEFGRPPIRVRVERKPTHWLLEVADAGAAQARRGTRFRQAGWGLRIVELLAESWGTGENGARVWCRIPAAGIRAGARER
jgi:signal transduction histidine kinase